MSRKKILIIDDDPNLRKTLSDILKLKGYEPLTAKDGTEGLELLKQVPVNLVVIDLGLPDISGLDVLNRVKADYPGVEAIILTGNASLDSAIEATNKGAFSYLLKPYEISQLLLHCRHALEKQEAQETIVRHILKIERMNARLKALYEVSLAINQTIYMDELISKIIRAVTKIEFIGPEGKCTVFIAEKDRMRLVSHIGLSDAELEPFMRGRVEEYLGGQTAATGELIVLKNAMHDGLTATEQPAAAPNGHILVPLTTVNGVVGVLCLFVNQDMELDKDMSELLLSLGNQIGIAIENAKHYEETKSFSLHDSLTGLSNRRFLDIELEKSFDSARRYGEKLAAIMLDIDYFKKYNDTRGHIEGDKILVKLAGILLRETRSSDHVFRYGGEEFLIILLKTDLAKACEVAERLRRLVAAETEIAISLGVAIYQESMVNGENLVERADSALYRAKREGRNMVVTAD